MQDNTFFTARQTQNEWVNAMNEFAKWIWLVSLNWELRATSPELAQCLGKIKVCFHCGPHDSDCVYTVVQCLLRNFYSHAEITFFFSFFQFRLCGFWLNKAVEGITNFASGFGGYLSLYVVWGIDFLPPTTLMKLLLEVPLGIHLVLITLSYLIWSLFKQEWILRFASGVCLSKGPFLLVFVFKVKAWLMWLIFPSAVLSSHVEALWLFKNIKTHQTVGYTFFLKTLAAFSSSSVQLLYLTIYT